MMKKLFLLVMLLTTTLYFGPTQTASGQGEIEVQCGQIVEGEFTDNMQEHFYLLNMAPRESFEVSVNPFGDFLSTILAIYGPSGVRIGITGGFTGAAYVVSEAPSLSSGTTSARGLYRIRVANTAISNDGLNNYSGYYGGVGMYELAIGCTTNDGTKVKPGDYPSATATPEPIPTATTRSAQPNQTLPTSEPSSESPFSFLKIGQSYEITFGSQTKIVKLIELTDAGWAKIEVNGGIGWLNLYQVALIIPLD